MIQERKKPPRNVSKGVILLVVALGLGILRWSAPLKGIQLRC